MIRSKIRPGAIAALILVAALAAPRAGAAQTAMDMFEVSLTVENDCTIQVGDLEFGSITDLTSSATGATSGTVTCTGSAPVTIEFDAGTGGSSTLATRQLEAGGETIDYNLYRDSGYSEVLGDGDGGTFTIGLTSSGGDDAFDVYAETSADQNPKPPGTYTSTITATVTF